MVSTRKLFHDKMMPAILISLMFPDTPKKKNHGRFMSSFDD